MTPLKIEKLYSQHLRRILISVSGDDEWSENWEENLDRIAPLITGEMASNLNNYFPHNVSGYPCTVEECVAIYLAIYSIKSLRVKRDRITMLNHWAPACFLKNYRINPSYLKRRSRNNTHKLLLLTPYNFYNRKSNYSMNDKNLINVENYHYNMNLLNKTVNNYGENNILIPHIINDRAFTHGKTNGQPFYDFSLEKFYSHIEVGSGRAIKNYSGAPHDDALIQLYSLSLLIRSPNSPYGCVKTVPQLLETLFLFFDIYSKYRIIDNFTEILPYFPGLSHIEISNNMIALVLSPQMAIFYCNGDLTESEKILREVLTAKIKELMMHNSYIVPVNSGNHEILFGTVNE